MEVRIAAGKAKCTPDYWANASVGTIEMLTPQGGEVNDAEGGRLGWKEGRKEGANERGRVRE